MRKIKLSLIRGTFKKKLTTSILLALFSVTIFTPTHVEASWLSKTWKKIEKSWNEAGTLLLFMGLNSLMVVKKLLRS